MIGHLHAIASRESDAGRTSAFHQHPPLRNTESSWLPTHLALGSGMVACVSPVTLQSIPGECLRFTDQLAHSCAQFHAFLRVAAVTKISIALTLGCSGALAASMFSASGAAVNGRRATRLAGSRSSPAATSLAQSHRLGAWVHRVVRHFQVSPSAGALFTIPTTPWAPG
jgi:hypothetical protein